MKAGSEPSKRDREVANAEECCKLANDRFHLQEQVRHLQDAAAKYELRIKELEEALRNVAYDEEGCCLNPDAAEALSTTSPHKTLQRAVLEARIDEIGKDITRIQSGSRMLELRDELAALERSETLKGE